MVALQNEMVKDNHELFKLVEFHKIFINNRARWGPKIAAMLFNLSWS